MNGASRTLEEIGYVDYLKRVPTAGKTCMRKILAEKDPATQALLRKQSVLSDYYLGSAHAVTQTGELVIASNSGKPTPPPRIHVTQHYSCSRHTQNSPDSARCSCAHDQYVLSLEDQRMKERHGYGTQHNKTLILHGENPLYSATF